MHARARSNTGLVLLVLTTACGEGATEPYSIPVTLSEERVPAGASGPPTIALVGDFVVARATLAFTGCDDYSAVATRTARAIVLRLVARADPERFCLADLEEATFRLAVRVPAGD